MNPIRVFLRFPNEEFTLSESFGQIFGGQLGLHCIPQSLPLLSRNTFIHLLQKEGDNKVS